MKIGIAIFAYNRPSHLKRLLIALEDYKIKKISAFVDGPKNARDKLIQEQIFFMLKNNKKIKISIFLRKKNIGLAKSLMLGLSYMSKKYPFFIALEDDVIPYKNFFKFSIDTVNSTNSLHHSCRVPWQIVIYHYIGTMQINPFRQNIGGN